MKIRIFLLCTASFFFSDLSAQETFENSEGSAFSEFSVLPAFQVFRPAMYNRQDFMELAPNSQLLREDFSEFQHNSGMLNNFSTGIDLMLGIQFADRDQGGYKNNPQLRLGLSFQSINLISSQYSREESRPYDTLVSSQTGQEYFIDTVSNYNYHMDYSMDRVEINASLIWRTEPARRMGLYAGIGAAFNVGFNTNTQISYFESGHLTGEVQDDFHTGFFHDSHSRGLEKRENFRNSTSFGGSFFIPMGLEYGLSKDHEFWKRLKLFYEFRPGMDFQYVPELGTNNRIYFLQGIGLRYS